MRPRFSRSPRASLTVTRLTLKRRQSWCSLEIGKEVGSSLPRISFPIASEHQLCRRFNVSRVTVRLALGDLEHRALIYRRHGKGTYANGRSKRANRSLGILIKSPDALKQASIVEIIRGVQAGGVLLRSSL